MKIKTKKIQEWVKSHKPHTAGIIVAIIAIIALSVAGATGLLSEKTAKAPENKDAITAVVPTDTTKTPVEVNVAADEKVTEASTPVIMHVESTDKRKEPVDFYHAVDSGVKTDTVEVSPGEYKITVTGVINSDGSVAKPKTKSKEIALDIKSTDKSKEAENKAHLNVNLDKTIPSDKVADKDIKDIADTAKNAVTKGDESLKGDAGKAILEKVDTNAKANKNVSDEVKDKVTESTEKASKETEKAPEKAVTTPPSSANKPSKPAEKVKVWVAEQGHYENTTDKVWVPNVVTVVDKPAWTEEVKTGRLIYRFSDGHLAYSEEEFQAYDLAMLKAGTPVSYTWYPETKTVTHPATTHTEDQGHYETRVTGKKWVVDVPGHWK